MDVKRIVAIVLLAAACFILGYMVYQWRIIQEDVDVADFDRPMYLKGPSAKGVISAVDEKTYELTLKMEGDKEMKFSWDPKKTRFIFFEPKYPQLNDAVRIKYRVVDDKNVAKLIEQLRGAPTPSTEVSPAASESPGATPGTTPAPVKSEEKKTP